MRIQIISFLLISSLLTSCNKELTGDLLLDKAISYHDPSNNWSRFNGTLLVSMETPNKPNRESKIMINLPEDYFYVKAVRDTLTTEYEVTKSGCTITFNGNTEFTEEVAKKNGLNCERATMYKNYYTYLYGLPMKLKDPGTHISDSITHKTFKGKEYLVLKATYDETVGHDIWYFYFDPETYAMEIYQFYRMDDDGNQKDDTGEYIILTEKETINGIKLPKNRAWYTNKDDTLLGTDILKKE